MSEDRLHKDYDLVENLEDLIEAREERDSYIADDVDGMEDIKSPNAQVDVSADLTFPHPKTHSSKDDRLGININLMDTPDANEVGFDWQDSAEEMQLTDPESDEGMGEDSTVEFMEIINPSDFEGTATSDEISPETDTAATQEERREYDIDGGAHTDPPVQVETGMDTDSDEYDFSIQDKFGGQITKETAELEFEEMLESSESEEVKANPTGHKD